jgi:hypothetical protein
MLSSKLVRLPAPPAVGLGLRLLKLPMGLVTPLRNPPPNMRSLAGVTTEIRSSSSVPWVDVSIAAALSRTEGTHWSSCSLTFERGMRR